MANISQHHGEVSKCPCGIIDHPDTPNSEKACRQCYNRGFIAKCKACDGQGQIKAAMAGGPGTMSSTCIPCGGTGSFGVNKPADWVEEAKTEAEPALTA